MIENVKTGQVIQMMVHSDSTGESYGRMSSKVDYLVTDVHEFFIETVSVKNRRYNSFSYGDLVINGLENGKKFWQEGGKRASYFKQRRRTARI